MAERPDLVRRAEDETFAFLVESLSKNAAACYVEWLMRPRRVFVAPGPRLLGPGPCPPCWAREAR